VNPNPYVGLDPLSSSYFIEVAILYWPAFLTLSTVAVTVGRGHWLLRHRPLQRFEIRDYQSSLWSCPILVWALETSFFTLRATRFDDFYRVGAFGRFTHVFFLHAFLTLCVLVALQLASVSLLSRGNLGLGTAGHFRVSMLYALMAVVLDSFLLLSVVIGNWPRIGRTVPNPSLNRTPPSALA
jgi:hypothetical protein